MHGWESRAVLVCGCAFGVLGLKNQAPKKARAQLGSCVACKRHRWGHRGSKKGEMAAWPRLCLP